MPNHPTQGILSNVTNPKSETQHAAAEGVVLLPVK
jgi:hypothetical protein